MGSLCWSGLLTGTCRPIEKGAHTEAGLLAGFVGDTHWSSLFLKDCNPTEQGKTVRSPSPEEKGAAETKCNELTRAPIPLYWQKELENSGGKLSLGGKSFFFLF